MNWMNSVREDNLSKKGMNTEITADRKNGRLREWKRIFFPTSLAVIEHRDIMVQAR